MPDLVQTKCADSSASVSRAQDDRERPSHLQLARGLDESVDGGLPGLCALEEEGVVAALAELH